jgi:transposase, IS5 family
VIAALRSAGHSSWYDHEAIVLRTVSDQPTLWDAILPSELLVLPVELARVDAMLHDSLFFAPLAAYFDARIGRPSIPMEVSEVDVLEVPLRLGDELLCREVADSISWQRFCRIPLGTRVRHLLTLMKITSRCSDDAVAGLGDKAQIIDNADGVILDHTVEIGNPRDAPQLAPAVERITRRTGRSPRAVTADRGYDYASVERDLHALGVRSAAIPRTCKRGVARHEFEHRRSFRNKINGESAPKDGSIT